MRARVLAGCITAFMASGLVLPGCSSSPKDCSTIAINSVSVVTVLAPDGSEVCDATVTVDGAVVQVAPPPGEDAGCAYLVNNGFIGDGAHEVVAKKSGYLDARGTIHVTGGSTGCPQAPPKGEDLTLHLVPIADGGADTGTSDAGA